MAYTDHRTGRSQRATILIVVAALQGAAIVALVNGLAIKWLPREPDIRTAGEQIPLRPLPPPPEIKPQGTKTHETVIDRPATRIPIPGPGPGPGLLPQPPTGGQTVIADPVPPTPAPPTTPARANPRGNPGNWVTPNDYPTRDIREGNQGVTGFRLTIDAAGRVQSCAVTRSSGFTSLDEAACRLLQRRAKFEPARQGGQPVTGEYASSVRWQIPD